MSSQAPSVQGSNRKPRMLTTQTVREEFFSNQVTPWWIRRNVAPSKKIRLSHSVVVWYEDDVREWLESRRSA